MKIRKFNGFNENGYLPYGIYNMTFEEFRSTFGENSTKRKEIITEYEKHMVEIKNTGYFLDHWIDGSFVSTKENPNDIDTLTEFNGFEAEKNNDKEKIENIISNSRSMTNNKCHSLRVYRYPSSDEIAYKLYLKSKMRILLILFGHDREGIPKGIIHLIGD